MAGEWRVETFENAPLQIIDGDRGTNYPNQAEFSAAGHCLFLNAGNVTTTGFKFSDCAYITTEKDASLRKGKLVRNDVVLTTRGTVGNAAYFDDSVPFDHIRINSGMVILRAQTPALYPRYLYLFVRSALFHAQVSALRTGSAQPQLPIQDINRIEIPIPPPDEQRAIAHILGTLDDKIELNRRMNETLEAMARALFKSWFVDFDPVRAKAEGRDPGLPKSLADLFSDSFEDSELGEIPKGWGTHPLGNLLSLDKGLSYKGQFLTEHGVPMVNLGCFLGRGRFTEKAIKKYSGEYKSRHVVRPWDLVLANTDITQQREVIGSPALVPPQGNLSELIFSHHVFAARFHEGAEFWKMFVYFLLLQDDFRARAAGFATGTTVLALPRDAALNLRYPGAPRALIAAFAEVALPIMERGWKRVEESRTLVVLRDTLLPKLISGELRVKDAEKVTEVA